MMKKEKEKKIRAHEQNDPARKVRHETDRRRDEGKTISSGRLFFKGISEPFTDRPQTLPAH